MKKQLLLWLMPFALLACRGGGDPKGVSGPAEEAGASKAETLTPDEYRERGLKYTLAAQASLGKTLQQKIREEGALDAIEFCSLNALAITDSLSGVFGARISRITDRPRNPQNTASAEEMRFISNFRGELSTGQSPEALVVRQGERTNFYYPIVTNDLCLQCHGRPESEITPEVQSVLQQRYPQDRAVGYAAGELRGLWKVSFPEEQP